MLSGSLRDDVYGSLFQLSGSVSSFAGHKSSVSERHLVTAGNTESLTFVMLRPSNAENVSPDRCTNASGGANFHSSISIIFTTVSCQLPIPHYGNLCFQLRYAVPKCV
ncbi:hypothetical protein Tco_0329305 [Tanacetum coccineum]